MVLLGSETAFSPTKCSRGMGARQGTGNIGLRSDLRGCMQAPMAFAGYHASKDESQIVQPPIAFSGRSRTHRLVEVRQIVSNMVVCQCLRTLIACVWTRGLESKPSNFGNERAGHKECFCHEIKSWRSWKLHSKPGTWIRPLFSGHGELDICHALTWLC